MVAWHSSFVHISYRPDMDCDVVIRLLLRVGTLHNSIQLCPGMATTRELKQFWLGDYIHVTIHGILLRCLMQELTDMCV